MVLRAITLLQTGYRVAQYWVLLEEVRMAETVPELFKCLK